MLIVFEIAPETNGWTAPTMRRCPSALIERCPALGCSAQSNTGRCSSRSALPSMVPLAATCSVIRSISSFGYPRLASVGATARFTILIWPPPTSRLYFVRATSGSMPVVSQSIMKLMVPVGAITLACALRYPCSVPSVSARSQASRARCASPVGTPGACVGSSETRASASFSAALRCAAITSSMLSRLEFHSVNGPPQSRAMTADCA